jgi:transcriptional regulator with XRE-family HTH domain
MRRVGKEKLADYVRRVMRQKQLKLRDVERRSGGGITNGYISGIINGRISNVSLVKLQALAKGLEVDVHELFSAAVGQPQQGGDARPANPHADLPWLLGVLQEAAANPLITKMLQDLVEMTPREREMVAKVSDAIVKSRTSSRRSSGRKRA